MKGFETVEENDAKPMNFALLARTEIALYRVLRNVNFNKSWAHRNRALEAAAAAYDAGQAGSPLLADEPGLVFEGRVARERKSPLKTNFALWLRPLIEVAPQHDLSSLAKHFDQMSFDDWCHAGDRASVIDSAFECGPINTGMERAFGTLWRELQVQVHRDGLEFCAAAAGRAELAQVSVYVRGYLRHGVGAALFAIGELALKGCASNGYWQSYVFELDDRVVAHA